MKSYSLILLGILVFSGCATTKIFDYQSLQGAPIKSAIYQLGIPDAEQDMKDFIVYSWYGTQITEDTGFIFRSGDFKTYYECEIKILVEYDQIIKVETKGEISKCPGRYY
tara:strand:- start:24 stop:353 length:330 start_codon:yes stop_codon:yes gene_type:complete